jgi:hypothetical protein
MATYTPTITTYGDGVVSVVSTDGTSYETILNSMGSFVYGVSEMYIKADSNDQILESFKFNRYNVNGNLESFVDAPTIDPYQYQSSIFLDMKRDDVVLDGRTNLNFSILPNESVSLILYTNQMSNRDCLPKTEFFCDDFFISQLNIKNDYIE